MSKKDELKGGLSALFGESPKEEPVTPVAPVMVQEPTTAQDEEDLINTIDNEALRAALHKRRMEGRGRPRKNTDERGNRTDGYSRTSLIVNQAKFAKIREIAFRESLTMKEIVEAALDIAIERYEAKHGEIKPQPNNYKGDAKKIFD